MWSTHCWLCKLELLLNIRDDRLTLETEERPIGQLGMDRVRPYHLPTDA